MKVRELTSSMYDNHVTSSSGQFKYPAVQRYVHDLTGEMGEHLDSIASSLSMFIEIGTTPHSLTPSSLGYIVTCYLLSQVYLPFDLHKNMQLPTCLIYRQ